MKNFDIFISYSSKDKSVAERLITHIESKGYTCWIAPRNIEGGAEYSEVIEQAILNCKIFLLVFSEHSDKSPWVKSELNIAFSENRYIIPYKIDTTPLKGTMRLLLNDKHWIDKNTDENKQIDLLLSAIQNCFTMLEQGKTDTVSHNSFYINISKQKRNKKILVGVFSLVFLLLVGTLIFTIFPKQNKKIVIQYQELIESALSIEEMELSDMVFKRDRLIEAQNIEKEVPISQRKAISGTLLQLNLQLDSIYFKALDDAHFFAELETKNGDIQALEFYKKALQIKEDAAVRSEYIKISSRKGDYDEKFGM